MLLFLCFLPYVPYISRCFMLLFLFSSVCSIYFSLFYVIISVFIRMFHIFLVLFHYFCFLRMFHIFLVVLCDCFYVFLRMFHISLTDLHYFFFQGVVRWLQLYYVPVISITGLLTNMACVLIMSRYSKPSPAHVYTVALVLAESLQLLALLHEWCNEMGADL